MWCERDFHVRQETLKSFGLTSVLYLLLCGGRAPTCTFCAPAPGRSRLVQTEGLEGSAIGRDPRGFLH